MNTTQTLEKYTVCQEDARKIADWLAHRGGIAYWSSVDLSNPSKSWTTPLNTADGQPTGRPTWQADDKPDRIITDAAEVEVAIDKVVKRFHVAVKRADSFNFVCTDAASRRIRRETQSAGPKAYHVFDYMAQDAVIMKGQESMERNDTIKRIKTALQRRSGKQWSVTGGKGTAWGWLEIDAPPARRTWSHRLKTGAVTDRPEDYEEFNTGEPGHNMGPEDRAELGKLLGLDHPAHDQGVSVGASNDYWQEYIDRAEGRQPAKIAQPYWD